MTTPSAQGSAPPQAADGRAAPPRQLWQVPAFLTGLLAVALITAGNTIPPPAPARQLERDLAALRQGMKHPRGNVEQLLALAEKILAAADQPERAGEAHLFLGALRARLADKAEGERAKHLRQKAREHLDLAEKHGIAASDRPRMQYTLAKLLYLSGGDRKKALDELTRWTDQGADDPAEGYGYLVQIHLTATPPDLDAALQANAKVLEKTDDDATLATARLQRAELQLKRDQHADALRVLKQVNSTSPKPVRSKALYLQAKLAQESGLWAQAVPLWKELLADPSAVPGGKAGILYALGACHAALEPRDDDAAAKAWEEASALGGEEGQAAALKLAELRLGGTDTATALDCFRRALEKVTAVEDYKNGLIDLEQVRDLFEAGCKAYKDGGDHERGRQLAELYRKVALPSAAEDRLAEACEALGRGLLEKAQAAGTDAEKLAEEARARLAEAGAAYEQSAAGRAVAEQGPRLWRAADCHLLARDHGRAVAVLQKVVQQEPDAQRQVEAWFALAGTHRALKQSEEARKAYHKCIEYPNSHFTYKARFELADVEMEQGNLGHAEEILMQNLTVGGATPDRQAEEQSLYRLADLTFGQRKYDKSKYWLEKALLQYPGSATELAVRDRLGECHRRMAEQMRLEGEGQVAPQKRLEYQRLNREYLEAARDLYQKLADDLEQRAQGKGLAPVEDALLRKALFVAADCLFELPNQMPEALRRYKQMADRYRGRVEGLMACKRLWHCCAVINDAELARPALEATRAAIATAKTDLQKMPEEAFKNAPDRSTQTEWHQWLNDIGQRLGLLPLTEAPRMPAQLVPPTAPLPAPPLPTPPGR